MYIWRGRNRRDRRENKLSGLFSWGSDKAAYSTSAEDDILRQEGEEIHTGYFRDRIRVVIHEYLNTDNGKEEVKHMVNHLEESAQEKAHAEAKAAAEASGVKFDKRKVVVVNDAVTKRHNIYEVFRKYDADGGGTLDPDELRVLLNELKVPMTDDELVELFDELDEDGEGGIDFEEFYTWFVAEAEKQRKKDPLTYYANVLSGGMFDGFAKLVMEVEARNLCMDHAVWTFTKQARVEYRIAHPPRFLCEKPGCGDSFATQEAFKAHKDNVLAHDEKDREREETHDRFHTVELFLAGPHGRMVLANRLLYSTELADLQVRIRSVSLTPFRPRTLDPENKREAQMLRGMLVQGYDPKMGVRAGYRRRGMRTQHLAPGRRAGQPVLQDVIAKLLHAREDTIDIISSPSTAQHAPVCFTWKGFARKTIEIVGNFNGWKREPLSPYLQIPPPPQQFSSVQDDAKDSVAAQNDGALAASKSLTFGRSSIIKQLGPGKYFYRYVIDGVELLDEKASVANEPISGIASNSLLVINPIVHAKEKLLSALTRMLGDGRGDRDDDSSVVSNISGEKVVKSPVKKGPYDDLVHLNSLHSAEAQAAKNKELQGLSVVNLRNMSLYDDGAWAFASFMQRNSLIRELDISFNSMSDEGMQAIATILPLMKVLDTLRANGNGFGFDGLRYIMGALVASKTIVRLELSGNNLCDDGAELIGTTLLPRHATLLELYLDENKIGNDGIERIGEGILRNKILTTLSVSKNLIYNYGIQRFALAVQSSGTLKYLRISDCPLGPLGGKCLGDMLLQNDSLTYVDFSNIELQRGNDAHGAGAIVSGISKNKALKHVVLKANSITDMQATDIIQALEGNFSMEHIDLVGNPISAKYFKPDFFFATKMSRETPSITTRLAQIKKIKEDPESKKYIGKPREIDDGLDGRWTWRRKWKAIDRKAEERRAMALSGSAEAGLIQIENEYMDEQLEKYMLSISSFLDNPNCQIFLTTTAKLLVQHMYDLLLLEPEPPPRDYAAEEAARVEEALRQLAEDKAKRMEAKARSWQSAGKKKEGSGCVENDEQEDDEGVQAVAAKKEEIDPRAAAFKGSEGKPIPWDDVRFNHAHIALCKCIFIDLGASTESLFLPYQKLEQAFQMLGLPLYKDDVQAAVHETQVTNQPLISFKKFLQYTKKHAKRIVGSNYWARMRLQADLYFRPPLEDARVVIIESFRYHAKNDIRKNYRAQLEKPPMFVCAHCQERFSSIKGFERHEAKGEGSIEHRRLEMLAEVNESVTQFLRRAKWIVTNTFFPAFYELSPETRLPEDYIPQVFDSMGVEGRPIGVIEERRTLLVEDVLGDFMQVAYEGRLGWVKYQLPNEKEKLRRVLRPACEDVPNFSWKSLRVNSSPVYMQVRDDKGLPKTFEIKVRAEPFLESPVIGYLKMGQIVESRATVSDWIHVRFENFDCAWVVRTVGGGAHRPPLTRAEQKAIARAEAEKRNKKAEERRRQFREWKLVQNKKRSKPGGKVDKFVFVDKDVEEAVPPGMYGADTMRMLHAEVQKRLRKTVVESPFTPTEDDLDLFAELTFAANQAELADVDGEVIPDDNASHAKSSSVSHQGESAGGGVGVGGGGGSLSLSQRDKKEE